MTLPNSSLSEFKMGEHTVQPLIHRIKGPSGTQKVEPRVMHILIVLARHQGKVVLREQLMREVWPDTFVGEEALNNAISKLRKLFGDTAKQARVIETIPKTGYRLVPLVSFEYPSPRPDLEKEPAPTAFHPIKNSKLLRAILFIATGSIIAGLAYWFGSQRTQQTPQQSLNRPTAHLQASIFTSYAGEEINPVIAPDSRRVAFAWRNPEHSSYDIYVKQRDSEIPLQLTDHPGYEDSPAWSPDGHHLVFQRFSTDERAIYTVPALGGQARKLIDCPFSIYPDITWSPDGSTFAFNHRMNPEDRFAIFLADAETLIQRQITTPPPQIWGDHDPTFSPDGKWVAFVRSVSEGIQDIYLVSVAGGEQKRITFDHRNIQGVTWELDQQHLVFGSNRDGIMALRKIPLQAQKSSIPILLPMYNWGTAKPHISPDGQWLALQQKQGHTDIFKATLKEQEELPLEPILNSTRWDLHPQYSPNGNRIAFSSNRMGPFEIWVSEKDGKQPIRLTFFEGPFTGTPRWSPDGKDLVFDSRPDGHADIYLISAKGGKPLKVTQNVADDLAPTWSHDGSHILFASSRGGRWEVWQIPKSGGSPSQLTENGGYAAQQSQDGQSLYYTKFNKSGIWRKAGDQAEVRIIDDLESFDWGNWSLSKGFLYYLRRPPQGPPLLVRCNAEDGTALDHWKIPSAIPQNDPSLAISPDQKQILIGGATSAGSDLLISPYSP